MKVSYQWLKALLPKLRRNPSQLAELLTDLGLEVEKVETFTSIPGRLEGVVVGKVLECKPHPNADKLRLTRVDIGTESPVQIVCGAPNVDAGQTVLVATTGTTLYDEEGQPRKIKRVKIRGEVSEGMICSEKELHLGDDEEGIMVLDRHLPPGTPAAQLYDIEEDHIYDIALTPNRSDATGHLGIARDVHARLCIDYPEEAILQPPDVDDTLTVDNNRAPIQVEIRDTHRCKRYSGLYIRGIRVGPSPRWLQNRLRALGMRPINNVVDLTNFILAEYGQPLHAFDADKIRCNTIVVTTLPKGTTFTTLDGIERTLSDEDLMICDAELRPLCIAGVFGGQDSGVTESTTNVFLESAYFDPISVRKTAQRHQLRTEAAQRFEKGADPNCTVDSLRRAAYLLQRIATFEKILPIVDNYPSPIPPARITLTLDYLQRLSGIQWDSTRVREILQALQTTIVAEDDNQFVVEVPTNKADVRRPADLVEEILRIYSYNRIPVPSTIAFSLPKAPADPTKLKSQIASYLIGLGFHEIMGLSLMPEKIIHQAIPAQTRPSLVKIHNTSNVGLNVMRPDLILSGLETVAFNIRHQQRDLKLFEFGKVYTLNASDELPREEEQLSILISGAFRHEHWKERNPLEADFYDIKAVVQSLLQHLQLTEVEAKPLDGATRWSFAIQYTNSQGPVAELGQVHPRYTDAWDIAQPVYGAILYWERIRQHVETHHTLFQSLPKAPYTRRDLAIVVDEQVLYRDIERIIRQTAGKLLRQLQVFDVFRSEKHLGPNKKSYAVKMIFQHQTKTLADAQVDAIIQQIIDRLQRELHAFIRK